MNEENEENDYNDYRGNTPLIAAAADGDVPRLQELIAIYTVQGDLHEQLEEPSTNDGFTPLLWACMNSDTDAVRLLLAAGADPTNPGMTEELYDARLTPLELAHTRTRQNGSINEEILRLLMDKLFLQPRHRQDPIEAATPPYGKNYLRLLRKHTIRRKKHRRASLQDTRRRSKGRLRRASLSGGSRKTRRIKQYYNERKDYHYYKQVKDVLRDLDFSSIIDIGCRKSPMIKGLGKNVYKAMLDLQEIPPADGIHMIKADFYTWKPDRKYDVVLCLQVLEHLDKPKKFAQKLLQVGKTVIISVPYKWAKHSCKHHTQDPVDESKIKGWMGREPNEHYVVTDKGKRRIICVYH